MGKVCVGLPSPLHFLAFLIAMKPVTFLRNTWKKKEKRPSHSEPPSRDSFSSSLVSPPSTPLGSLEQVSITSSLTYSVDSLHHHFSPPKSTPSSAPQSGPSSLKTPADIKQPPGLTQVFIPQEHATRPAGLPLHTLRASQAPPRRPPRPPSLDLCASSGSPVLVLHTRSRRGVNIPLNSFLRTYGQDSDYESEEEEVMTPKVQTFHDGDIPGDSQLCPSRPIANSQDERTGSTSRQFCDVFTKDTIYLPPPLGPVPPAHRLHKYGSTPHLPISTPLIAVTDQSPNDPLSLFPAPPPLTLRNKKVPAPLILHNMSSIASIKLEHSPSISVNSATKPLESTPVTTPTFLYTSHSPTTSRAVITVPNYLFKVVAGRSQSQHPSPLYSPPTTPLPTPPISDIHQSQPSFRSTLSSRPLRSAFSTSNLRRGTQHAPTHRTTSSDSSSTALSYDKFESLNTSQKLSTPVSLHVLLAGDRAS